MKRRLFNVFAILSLLLCVATVVMWVRSSVVENRQSMSLALAYRSAGTVYQLSTGRVGLHLVAVRSTSTRNLGLSFEREYYGGEYAGGFRLRGLGFTVAYLRSQIRGTDWIQRPFAAVVLPYWFLVLATLAIPACHLRGSHKRRRDHQLGLCPTCGYDLRATPERCPECGTAQAKAATP